MGEQRVKLSKMRQMIQANLMKSLLEIPQVSGFTSVDCTGMLAMQQRLRERGEKVATSVFLAKAIAMGLEKFPQLNARLEGDEAVVYDAINAGIGTQTDNGLIVVVLRDLQGKPLLQINREFREMMGKVRDKKLTMDDITGGTFTISNMSKRKRPGAFSSIVNNQEAFIIGMSGIVKQPFVNEAGEIVVQERTNITMNMNHALMDGMTSGAFTDLVFDYFEDPERYMAE